MAKEKKTIAELAAMIAERLRARGINTVNVVVMKDRQLGWAANPITAPAVANAAAAACGEICRELREHYDLAD